MKKDKNINKEKKNKEVKHRGNGGEIFVKGMALILAILMVTATASSLIFAIMFA